MGDEKNSLVGPDQPAGNFTSHCLRFSSYEIDFYGGAERDRTADLLVANEALSRLSYSPPPNPHRTPLSQAQRGRNNISECTSNTPYDSTASGDRRQRVPKLPSPLLSSGPA